MSATSATQGISVRDGRNLKRKPWGHQQRAIDFLRQTHVFHEAIHPGQEGYPAWKKSGVPEGGGGYLGMYMGCIDGDAAITVNRAGRSFQIALRQLHYKFHGGESRRRRWRPDIDTLTGSMVDGVVRLNRIENVFNQGRRRVVRLTLASGKSLRLTPDHEVACPGDRWAAAQDLKPGDKVLRNGTFIDKDGYVRASYHPEHPRAASANQYVYEHILVMEQALGRYLGPGEEVHHKNRIRHDNRLDNLELLSKPDHLKLHAEEDKIYLHFASAPEALFIPKVDTVVSVEPDGEADVYDIQMAGPGHNFIANGILVHNCGKSLVGVSMAVNLPIDTALIICPKGVLSVWPQQFEAHAARTDLAIVSLDDKRRLSRKVEDLSIDMQVASIRKQRFILIANYDIIYREPLAAFLLSQTWGLVILDEIHKIKQPGGKQSMFAARLRDRAIWRLGLSGTPLPHSPLDAYGQYRFLRPDIFGTSYSKFKFDYAVVGGFQQRQVLGYRNLGQLEKKMGEILFRVGKDALDLPEELRIWKECELSPGAARIYQQLETELVAGVKDGTVTATNAMTKLLKLQQVTSGFVKTDDEVELAADAVNSKADLLREHFEDIDPAEPIVVFCRFKRDLALVHEIAKATGRTSSEFSGERKELGDWVGGKTNVLAVQIQAGGLGIDLTRARYSFYYSLGFNLGDYEQSLARVHRPGQIRTTFHIHLVAAGTVDTRIKRALEKRRDLVESILDEIKQEQLCMK